MGTFSAGPVCVSVSPVAMSVGLVSSGECWLLAYNDMAWRTHLFLILFFPVGMFPTLWGIASLSLLSTVCSLVASVFAGMSVSLSLLPPA